MFLLAFPLLLLALLATGLWCVERLRLKPGNPLEHAWLASVLGLLVMGTATSLLGFAQLLHPAVLWGSVLAGIGLGWRDLVWFSQRALWIPVFQEFGELPWPWRLPVATMLLFLAVQGLLALAPNTQWDTLAHHFLVPEMYLKWGGIYDLQQVQQSYFPSLFQMLYALGMGIGGEQTASLLGWWWSTLVAVGVLVIGRQFWRLEAGVAAAFVMLTQELYAKQLQGGWADSGVALLVLAGVYGLLRMRDSQRLAEEHERLLRLTELRPICGFALREMERLREESGASVIDTPPQLSSEAARPGAWQRTMLPPWGVFGALAMGGALAGSKHNALLPMLLLLGVWGLRWMLHRDAPFLTELRRLAVFCGLALLLPLCWYLRSWVLTGSPVYPLTFFGLFPGPELPVYAESSWIDRSYTRDFAALLTYPFLLTYSPSLIEGFQGRFPPQWPLLMPLCWWLGWKQEPVRWLTVLLVGTLGLMFLVAPKETRYMLFAVPWIALLTGGGTAMLLERVRSVPIQAVAVLLLMLVPFGLRQRDVVNDIRQRWRVIVKAESRGKYLGYASPNTSIIQWMNTELPDEAFVFCLEDRTYRLTPDWTNYYAATEGFPQTAVESYTFCYRQGVTHLFLGDGTIIQAQILKNIVDLPPDANGITHFRLSEVMINLQGELIHPERHWVAWTTVRRFLQRAGFDSAPDDHGIEVFSIPRASLLSTPVQQAHYNVMGAITEMHERRMMRLLKSDGLNMVFEYDYGPIGAYTDPASFGEGRPAWTRRH